MQMEGLLGGTAAATLLDRETYGRLPMLPEKGINPLLRLSRRIIGRHMIAGKFVTRTLPPQIGIRSQPIRRPPGRKLKSCVKVRAGGGLETSGSLSWSTRLEGGLLTRARTMVYATRTIHWVIQGIIIVGVGHYRYSSLKPSQVEAGTRYSPISALHDDSISPD